MPEADLQEQHLPPDPDPRQPTERVEEDLSRDEPEADVLEQQLPLEDGPDDVLVPDDDRVEPLDDDDLAWDEQPEGHGEGYEE